MLVAIKIDMRILFVITIIVSLNACLNAQIEADGVWECINETSIERSPRMRAFPFWIKFRGNEVLISNSNNSFLSGGGSYTYMKGVWEVKSDTLLVHISDTRRMSAHTGIFRDQIDGSDRFKPHEYLFIIEFLTDTNILLTPLVDFMGFSRVGDHTFPSTFDLGEKEKLTLERTDKSYYFDDKL